MLHHTHAPWAIKVFHLLWVCLCIMAGSSAFQYAYQSWPVWAALVAVVLTVVELVAIFGMRELLITWIERHYHGKM